MNKQIPGNRFLLKKSFLNSAILIIISGIMISACKTPANAYYFKTVPRDTSIQSSINRVAESKIKKNDLLAINFSSLNPAEDITYNAAAGVAASASASTGSASGGGYLVDAQGNIQLHKLGLVHAEGMTRAELKNKIQKDIEPYLKDPIVTVRYLNHRVSVMGEVSRPGVVQMPEERLSVLEVLSTSGDVTQFARRNNILIIRETPEGKELKRINLEDHSIFNSEWYFLKPDDVVYVEPNEKKLTEEKRNKTQQTIGLILSGVSIAVIILDRIIK
jgi:polysaccharide biosynthesis/export protein